MESHLFIKNYFSSFLLLNPTNTAPAAKAKPPNKPELTFELLPVSGNSLLSTTS
nr:hypothetical protein [Staphylococcus haemolyticus]